MFIKPTCLITSTLLGTSRPAIKMRHQFGHPHIYVPETIFIKCTLFLSSWQFFFVKTFPVVDLKGRSRRKLQIFIETRSDAFDPRFPFSSRSDCSSLVYEKVNSLSNAIKLIVIYESSLVKVVGKEISLKECLFCPKL